MFDFQIPNTFMFQYYKNQLNFIYFKEFICYSASNGKIYPGSIKEGDGVKVGETVKVVVNRNDKTIKWIVNGITRASLTNDMLGDKERLFYPFMEMKDQ